MHSLTLETILIASLSCSPLALVQAYNLHVPAIRRWPIRPTTSVVTEGFLNATEAATEFCTRKLLYKPPTFQNPAVDQIGDYLIVMRPDANCTENITGELCVGKVEGILQKGKHSILKSKFSFRD